MDIIHIMDNGLEIDHQDIPYGWIKKYVVESEVVTIIYDDVEKRFVKGEGKI